MLWGVLFNNVTNRVNVDISDKCCEKISFLLLTEQFKTCFFVHYNLPLELSGACDLNIELEQYNQV